jgi:hypothetical protein
MAGMAAGMNMANAGQAPAVKRKSGQMSAHQLVAPTPRHEVRVDGVGVRDQDCFNTCQPSTVIEKVVAFLETVDVNLLVSQPQTGSSKLTDGKKKKKAKKTMDYLNRWNPEVRSWCHKHLYTPRGLNNR